MNRAFNFAVIAMTAVIMANSRVGAAVVNVTEGSTSGYTMTNGNTYIIQDSVSFSNSTAGGSGMEVEDGATVVIYVPTGVTLTATGANGSGQTGGGAGIRVPETATLIITGEGTVNVAGGNAGDGENGGNGSNGSSISCAYGQYPTTVGGTGRTGGAAGKGSSGCGGSGGNGGGGAGVAIGGIGGCGGSGGSSGASRTISSYVTLSGFCGNGNNGANGSAGMSGDSMGFCYLLGRTTVIAVAGQTGKSGDTGNKADWTYYLYKKSSSNYHFATCGGGGGGGGGAGNAPSSAIGGGGSAGGGGGGGGSGATSGRNDELYNSYPLTNAHGGGGAGGDSNIMSGMVGEAKEKTYGGYRWQSNNTYPSYYYGGDGGNGGAAGAEGGAGTLYVSPTATVDVDREKLSATTHPAAQYTITFDANGGQFSSAVDSLTATLGCELPDCIPTPTRRGYLFDGWRTMTDEEYYGTSGTKSISSYPVAGNVILYAQWHWDDNVDYTVTTPEAVPYSYFDTAYPMLLAEYGGDYEAAAKATAANGYNKVWECYVAGISPTNETAKFTAAIEMVDGVPQITWSPNLNTNGIERTYTIWGKTNLMDGVEWECPTNSAHRFFKVTVDMP